MRVLVTGGTGRLGRVFLPRLVEAGFAVRAMSRRPGPAQDGVEWVVADLATGEGVAQAVGEVDAVAHLASAPYKGRYTVQVDVDGTRRLVEAAHDAGAGHVLYVSIVGLDRVPWGYFRTKTRAEEVIKTRGMPWSIVRATQFHEFVDGALRAVSRLGVMIADPGIPGQPVDVRDVADRLVERIGDGPNNTIEDFGGPEVWTFDEGIRQWLKVRGMRRPILRVKLPGKLGAAFRAGHLTTDAQPTGKITWRRYLEEVYR